MNAIPQINVHIIYQNIYVNLGKLYFRNVEQSNGAQTVRFDVVEIMPARSPNREKSRLLQTQRDAQQKIYNITNGICPLQTKKRWPGRRLQGGKRSRQLVSRPSQNVR